MAVILPYFSEFAYLPGALRESSRSFAISSPDEFLLLLLVKCSLIWSKMPALQDKEERSGLSELVTFVGAANCVN